MIALVVLIVVSAWSLLGVLVWRRFLNSRIATMQVKVPLFLLFLMFWLVTPVLDEILGAREFERLCRKMPEMKFYGPVPVGPGELFDESGNPRWNNDREFALIRINTRYDEKLFEDKDNRRLLTKWPMPVVKRHSLTVDRRSGKSVAESFSCYSPGGWIKRSLGLGSHSFYQCPPKGQWPRDKDWIYFDAAQINVKGDAQGFYPVSTDTFE